MNFKKTIVQKKAKLVPVLFVKQAISGTEKKIVGTHFKPIVKFG